MDVAPGAPARLEIPASYDREMTVKTFAIISASVGAFLVLTYWVLSLTGVGNIGQPTDIGGGMLLLAGYVLILGGIVSFISVLVGGRPGHKG